MLDTWRTRLLVGMAVALAGCNAIFGVSKGELEEAASDGGAGAAGSLGGGAGQAGTAGGAGTSSGGTSGSAGTGGQGGELNDTAMAEILSKDQEFEFRIVNGDGEKKVKARFTYDFAIDVYEVTNNRYRAWRDGTPKFKRPAHGHDFGAGTGMAMVWDSGWDSLVNVAEDGCDGPSAHDLDHPVIDYDILTGDNYNPIVCMNWYAALALCASEGKRLPTETEWMYVATAAGNREPYPFDGDHVDCSQAIFDSDTLGYCGFPKPVGSAPNGISEHGLFDLSGSVFEWVWDQEADYPTDATQENYAGPEGFDGSQRRVRKGGAFISVPGEAKLETYGREFFPPGEFYNDAGFRCAKTL